MLPKECNVSKKEFIHSAMLSGVLFFALFPSLVLYFYLSLSLSLSLFLSLSLSFRFPVPECINYCTLWIEKAQFRAKRNFLAAAAAGGGGKRGFEMCISEINCCFMCGFLCCCKSHEILFAFKGNTHLSLQQKSHGAHCTGPHEDRVDTV
jgi:hypothetical protein